MLISWNVKEDLKKIPVADWPECYFDLGVAFWLLGAPAAELAGLRQKETKELFELAGQRLAEQGLERIFYEIELPLIPVLAEMEKLGVAVDQRQLKVLRRDYDKEHTDLKRRIIELAGEDFNVNSSQQLSRIIFEKLAIGRPGGRRTDSGFRSTDSAVLKQLVNEHPMIPLLLRYREVSKLLSTYINVWQTAGERIHTNFSQTATSTGRLSSQNPNLQNVPPDLRSVFVAAEDYSLAAFDYSQIELRILASVAGDEAMIAAFANEIDIHALTASRVFKIALDQVTAEMRRIGKMLNFGVVYGMGAAAFARASGLSRNEAEMFISEYFMDFNQIGKWQEEVKSGLREKGYVENRNGRRRWLLQIFSANPKEKAAAERAGINMPIQSLAADIIKLAMIKIYKELRPRMILTVHDELLFEVENAKLKESSRRICDIMESVYSLTVPLKVDYGVGRNWGEARH